MIDVMKILRQRENKLRRIAKREKKQKNYHQDGLNGERAVARRQRQLSNNQLEVN
jgi:hypothetical protein